MRLERPTFPGRVEGPRPPPRIARPRGSPGAEGGRRLWNITDTGEKEVRGLLDLPEAEPEIEVDVATLTKLAS